MEHPEADTLAGLVLEVAAEDAEKFADEARTYEQIHWRRTVQRWRGEYGVLCGAHTQRIESLLVTTERTNNGMHHSMLAKHPQRQMEEFAARHGLGDKGTLDRMYVIFDQAVGRRLTRDRLTGEGHARI